MHFFIRSAIIKSTPSIKERRNAAFAAEYILRVITGSARGRRLIALEGDDVRPTTDKVKEALFSIIQFEIEGRKVLDLFAGSGQLGIEALSRGAKSAVFVDASRRSIEVIKENIENTGFTKSAVVLNTDAISFAATRAEKYDIAFLDPPYRTGLLQRALPLVSGIMNEGGVIVCEAPFDEEIPEKAGDFVMTKEYKYGKIKLATYRREE